MDSPSVQTISGCSSCGLFTHKRPNHRLCPNRKPRKKGAKKEDKKPKTQTGWNKFSTLRRAELKKRGLNFSESQAQAAKEWKQWKFWAGPSGACRCFSGTDIHDYTIFDSCELGQLDSPACEQLLNGEFFFSVERGPRVKPTPEPVDDGFVSTEEGRLADDPLDALIASGASTPAESKQDAPTPDDPTPAQSTTSIKTVPVPNLVHTKPAQCLSIRRKKFICGECNVTVKVHADEDGDFFCPTCNYELI